MNTPKNTELLSILVEELGEATQAAGKLLRFGIENFNPVTGVRNLDSLEVEIGDVLVAIEMLADVGLIEMDVITHKHMPAKRIKLAQWLQHTKGRQP